MGTRIRKPGVWRTLFGHTRERAITTPSLLAAYDEMIRTDVIEPGDAEERFPQILAFARIGRPDER